MKGDSMKTKWVLVAEDNEDHRKALAFHLERAGHTVVSVRDGQVAWEILDEGQKFDLIMSDNNMPAMTGIELLRRVKADPRTAGIRFVLMSAWLTLAEEAEYQKLCSKFDASLIDKPFDLEKVIPELFGPKRVASNA